MTETEKVITEDDIRRQFMTVKQAAAKFGFKSTGHMRLLCLKGSVYPKPFKFGVEWMIHRGSRVQTKPVGRPALRPDIDRLRNRGPKIKQNGSKDSKE